MEREPMPMDAYREVQESDYQALADYFNQNNQREVGIWCKGLDIDANVMRGLIQAGSHRGNLVTQVHEKDGHLMTAFSGFERMNSTLFSIGIVDPNLPNYMDVWRQDSAKAFRACINRGNKNVYLHLSDDKAEIIDWMEKEVGLKRVPLLGVWRSKLSDIEPYVINNE